MSETEDRLYGLMEIAERQQAAVQAALDGLAAERAALGRERQALAKTAGDLALGTRVAAEAGVQASLAGAATEGVAAVQAATRPLLGRLADMTERAGQAEAALRRVVLWASWRLLGWVIAGVASLVLIGWVATMAVLWWDTGAIADAQVEKAQLQQEVAELQASHDAWVKAGMLGKLDQCGPKRRPCIRVDESAGPFGERLDYRVILGY
jgi:hypothetical protein